MLKSDFKFTFNVKEDKLNFQCQEDCGECCYGSTQMIMLTYLEVKEIQDFVSNLIKTSEFEKFVTDLTKFNFRQTNVWDYTGNLNYQKELMEDFFIPNFQGVTVDGKEIFITNNYLLRSLYPTNRCVFLNPITNKCLIYPARPLICRLYPFFVNFDIPKKSIEIVIPPNIESCPGTGKGETNVKQIEDMAYRFVKYHNEHFLKLAEFTKKLDIKLSNCFRDMALSENVRSKSEQKDSPGEKFHEMAIHSFLDMGRPSKNVFTLTNENFRDFFSENNLIKLNKEFLERLRKGECKGIKF